MKGSSLAGATTTHATTHHAYHHPPTAPLQSLAICLRSPAGFSRAGKGAAMLIETPDCARVAKKSAFGRGVSEAGARTETPALPPCCFCRRHGGCMHTVPAPSDLLEAPPSAQASATIICARLASQVRVKRGGFPDADSAKTPSLPPCCTRQRDGGCGHTCRHAVVPARRRHRLGKPPPPSATVMRSVPQALSASP